MKLLLTLLLALLLLNPCFSGILGPGKYNGVVIFDRWDGCHLYTGVFEMEISEKVKELLRPYRGKAVLIDAQEVYQPVNPGDALITKLTVLGPAEDTTPPHIMPPPAVEGLSVRAIPSIPEQGEGEFIIELRNDSSSPREIDTYALGPTVLTTSRGRQCLSPADGPSLPILTRLSVSFMQQYPGGGISCGTNGQMIAAKASLAPGFALSRRFQLDPGKSIEVPVRFHLPPGEYEFLAGYGGSYQGPSLASNFVDFDVDASGNPHLAGSSLGLNQPRTPRRVGGVCGRVMLENGNAAARANVYLWPLPFPKNEPRVANMATAGEDGTFRMEKVSEGKYILSAARQDADGISVGAFGGKRPLDGTPLSLPNTSDGCPLLITIYSQPTYTVRGHTEAGPGRTAKLILKSGDAFPWESQAAVQLDGHYEFRHVPAGRYQFFAGWTGSGFDVDDDIDHLDVEIRWPDPTPAGMAGPPDMPAEFNEQMTVLELKNLQEAERTYAKTYSKGFTKNLDVLSAPPEWSRPSEQHAGLLPLLGKPFLKDQDATHFTEHGYRFTYLPAEAGADEKTTEYTVSARPLQFGKTGNRSSLMDESGRIHATNADKPATREDPLVKDMPPY
ncbi:MAG: hypothetical protein ABSH49_06485 [Bryobacteraceae bacterium]|jgi:hypothetical protein